MRLPLVVLTTLLLLPLLAACGDGGGVGPAAADPSTTGPTSGPPTDLPTDLPTDPATGPTPGLPDDRLPPDPSGKPRADRTLTGVLAAGVEAGCLLLQEGGRSWLLLGPDVAGARPGSRVVVVGTPSPGTLTTCQQSTPFVVTRLDPAPG